MSKGEERISQLLKAQKIEFEREKTFPDLKHGIYRFDFYIPDLEGAPAIIEFQGEQHYYRIPAFFKTRAEFLHQQNNDRRKISYCLANKIKIYCIPFWELPNLKKADDCFNPKFLAKTRWKNDDDWRIYKNYH